MPEKAVESFAFIGWIKAIRVKIKIKSVDMSKFLIRLESSNIRNGAEICNRKLGNIEQMGIFGIIRFFQLLDEY